MDLPRRLQLAAELESQLGIQVEEPVLSKVRTVGELVDAVAVMSGQGDKPRARRAYADWPLSSPAGLVRRLVQGGLLFPLHSLLAGPFRVAGRERLSQVEGPVLLVASEGSHLDTLSILRALPPLRRRKTAIAIAADGRDPPSIGLFTSLLLNGFPFFRGSGLRESLERCGELADRGWSVLFLSKGTGAADGDMSTSEPELGVLAAGLNVPVVTILGVRNREITIGDRRLRKGPVSVRIGTPAGPADNGNRPGPATELHHGAEG